MGRKKTYVYSSTARMNEDDDVRHILNDVTLDNILKRRKANMLVPTLITAYSSTLPYKVARMYGYAERGKYAYGDVKSTYDFTKDNVRNEQVVNIVKQLVGLNVDVKLADLGDVSNYLMVWKELYDSFGYDQKSNQLLPLSDELGEVCYLQDVQIVYCKDTVDNTIESDLLSPIALAFTHGQTMTREQDFTRLQTNPMLDEQAIRDMAYIYITFRSDQDYTQDERFDSRELVVEKSDSDEDDEDSETANTGTTDDEGSKEDTDTASTDKKAEAPVEYWDYIFKIPMDFLKYEISGSSSIYGEMGEASVGVVAPTFHKEYISAEYVLDGKYYYLIQEHTADIVIEQDIQDVDCEFYPRIYIRLDGRRLNEDSLKNTERYKSSVKLCSRIGLGYDDIVEQIHKGTDGIWDCPQVFISLSVPSDSEDPLEAEYLYHFFDRVYNENRGKAVGTDIYDKVYRQHLSFSDIQKRVVQGKVSRVGQYSYAKQEFRTQGGLRLILGRIKLYRYQMSETEYIEISVNNLALTEFVQGGHTATHTENVLIPVDKSLLKHFSFNQKEKFLHRCLHITFNTIKVVKKKWYQTGIFQAIMVVIVAVISYFFPPAGIAAQTWLAAAAGVAYGLVVGAIIQVAVKLMVKLGINVKVAMVIAVIAMIAAGAQSAMNGGNLLTVANNMLKVANVAYKIVSELNQHEINTLAKNLRDLHGQYSEKYKELERAKELLGNSYVPLSMLDLSDRGVNNSEFITLGETPEMYYSKTLEQNAGDWVYAYNDGYFSFSLEPPNFQQLMRMRQQRINHLEKGIDV